MAEIKEFKGLFYDSEIVGDISSVVAPHCHSSEEETIKKYASNHPFNIIRLEYPSVDEEKEQDKYSVATDTLNKWLDTGILKYDDTPGIYIHNQKYTLFEEEKNISNIICRVKIDDGITKPHEDTSSAFYDDYKSDRYNLMNATGAVFNSIYAMYKDPEGEIAEIIASGDELITEFADNLGTIHTLWKITDADKINGLKEAFTEKQLVLADGHIRYSVAENYCKRIKQEAVEYSGEEPFNYVMMELAVLGDNLPDILPIHRIIKNKQEFDEKKIIEKLNEKFDFEKSYIRECDAPKIKARLAESREKQAIGFYTGKDYYYIVTPKEKVMHLSDSEILHKLILEPAFYITKDNAKAYLEYGTSIADCEKKVREQEANCAFYLNPMKAEEIYEAAEENKFEDKEEEK